MSKVGTRETSETDRRRRGTNGQWRISDVSSEQSRGLARKNHNPSPWANHRGGNCHIKWTGQRSGEITFNYCLKVNRNDTEGVVICEDAIIRAKCLVIEGSNSPSRK